MAEPKTVHIRVYLDGDPNEDPTVDPAFHLESSLPQAPNGNYVFENENHPGFYVHFDLQEPTYGYEFKGGSKLMLKEALYSAPGVDCPGEADGQWPQFRAVDVLNSNKTLVVRNVNGHKADFGYTLRITNDQGQTYRKLDPGGTNSNGPTSPLHSSFLTFAVVGLATGVVSALATAALYNNLICGAR